MEGATKRRRGDEEEGARGREMECQGRRGEGVMQWSDGWRVVVGKREVVVHGDA